MKRDIWIQSFSRDNIPRYPCPSCKERTLKLHGKVISSEPAYSEANHSHEDFEPEWAVERISFQLRCDVSACGELVNVIGESFVDYDWDDDHGQVMVSLLSPKAFFPAPPLIDFPSAMPDDARKAAEQAFAVCWNDTGSAANRIRVSVELSLDALKVPRVGIAKKTGKPIDLDLNGRIQWLEKQTGDLGNHASTFQALRVAGNAGSHAADDVSWDNLLDCFVLFEAAIEDLFGSKSAMLAQAKANLLKLKSSKKK